MSIDPIYLGLFVLVSCASAFVIGRFCRNGCSTGEPGAWERATTTKYEGMPPLSAADSNLSAAELAFAGNMVEASDLRAYIAGLPRDLADGSYGAAYKDRLRRLEGEPAPHLDVSSSEVAEVIEVEFLCDLTEGKRS